MLYRHLTLDQRYQIAGQYHAGFSQVEIAESIGCHPSTIGRELKRNYSGKLYAGSVAHGHAQRRRSEASSRPHISEASRLGLIAELKLEHSPEQICGRRAWLGGETVSQTTVYRYARANGLRHKLRHTKRRRGKSWPKRFTNRRSIHDRPPEVAARTRRGDWEGDTMRPASGTGVLVTMVDRFSGLLRLAKSPNGTAAAVTRAITRLLGPMKECVHTITCDRGSEFSLDAVLEERLDSLVFFADPRSPWQRGCNENINGLLRQYFPRLLDFSKITTRQLKAVEDRLNNRPRKRLNYQTPNEVFFNQ